MKPRKKTYRIEATSLAIDHLKALRAYDQRQVKDAIDQQLPNQPDIPTRNRKCLDQAIPPFEHVPPV